ncbi:MAG: PilZ domain-containing protein [Aminobacterium sp.]|jgi:c-di-GMP-binding flagellar brake protein YcgR|nr:MULTISPECIES: PilZ domain-containing protein [unclassified Aminobacterium]MDD2207087.1 PilZ domain-containing protein [Aminobacterium sp.]MDD3707448.1 PilZ domain-containing protein [Aminobacterium sp.]MDD4228790.1 PilZ domain-containing protein [Aminobacterium sp.]MDD4550591.1 PilZ domain-containing protein [Aminobacterium sp.]MEA4876549.1 PilZ domain-containing protein [Aminobacterium sp.]
MDLTHFLSLLDKEIGKKVFVDIRAGLYKGRYPSRLEDIRKNQIAVAHPMLKGALLPIHRSLEIVLQIEIEGSLYEVAAFIVRSSIAEQIPLLWVEPHGEVIKLQRRRFVRVPCIMKMEMFLLQEAEQFKTAREEKIAVTAKDISLGGCGFLLDISKKHLFENKRRYLCRLFLPETEFLVPVSIMRNQERDGRCEVGVSFDILPISAEKSLGNFIRQQELINR